MMTLGSRWRNPNDGFVGVVIGHYTTLDGEHGVVLQMEGTKIVHVYREKWLVEEPKVSAG